MAKKEKEGKEEKEVNSTDQLLKKIEKEYGEGLILGGTEVANNRRMLIPFSPSFDLITSGGIQEGSRVSITGNEKSFKTTSALSFAARCQLPEFGGRKVFFADVEHRITEMHLKGIKGLILDPPHFNVIKSRKGKILTAEEHLEIYCNILQSIPGAVLIIDSISSLCDGAEMTGGVGTASYGSAAKLVSQFLRITKDVIPVNNSIVLGITHLLVNVGSTGSSERAAKNWRYMSDYQLRVLAKEKWTAGEKVLGMKVKWVCNCSKQGPPFMSTESYVRFGTGVDRMFEMIQLGVLTGLVKQGGAWYTLDFIEGSPKFQGGENLYQALSENQDWARQLEKEIMSRAGASYEDS